MPAAAAAACARSAERLAMARSSAWAHLRKAGKRRSLMWATPRTPQRSLSVGMGRLAGLGIRASRERQRPEGLPPVADAPGSPTRARPVLYNERTIGATGPTRGTSHVPAGDPPPRRRGRAAGGGGQPRGVLRP